MSVHLFQEHTRELDKPRFTVREPEQFDIWLNGIVRAGPDAQRSNDKGDESVHIYIYIFIYLLNTQF
jgi:hypothetical protein